jgi:hypothetical protein
MLKNDREGFWSRWTRRAIMGKGAADALGFGRDTIKTPHPIDYLHPTHHFGAEPTMRTLRTNTMSTQGSLFRNQFEEVENEPSVGTKARRAIEFVSRRHGNVRDKKSNLGRDTAIRRVSEATAHIQDLVKEKKAKKGAEAKTGSTTAVDTHPTLKKEPIDQVRW